VFSRTNFYQTIVLEKDLDLQVAQQRRQTSVYAMVGTMGGLVVVFYLIGYCLVGCLAGNAYEDNMISTVYPTKDVLKERVRSYTKDFPEKEQKKWHEILLPDEKKED